MTPMDKTNNEIRAQARGGDSAIGAERALDDASRRARGWILVVDDEELICRVVSQMAACLGFQVLSANSGRNALELFRVRHRDIAAVLLDEAMPNQSGGQVLAEMQAIQPDVKVVLCTGYSESEAMGRFGRRRLAGYLQKPFSLDALAEKLKAILEPA